MSIEVKKDMQKVADFIFENLKMETSNFGAIITKHEENDNITVLIACEEYNEARMKIFASNSIVEAICIFFKQDFLTKTLKLPIKEGIYYQALKKALLSFDKETDAFLVSKELQLENNLNLEAFYYFKLKNLRDKWGELANIANDNGYFLVCNENFVDLLKFLVDNLEITHDTINVYLEDGHYKVFDGMDKTVELNDEEDIVSSLIGLSPRQINFYTDKTEDEKISLLCKIFDKRVFFKKRREEMEAHQNT